MVAEGRIGIADRTRAVEIHPAVEFEDDVFRRSVGTSNDGEVAALHHGYSRAVGVVRRRCSHRISAVGQTVGVETFVTVRTVFAGNGDARNLLDLAVSRIGLV
jgi:hypothetical protein